MNPETDPYTARYAMAGAKIGFNNATNVEDAPSSAKLVGREWIKDIP